MTSTPLFPVGFCDDIFVSNTSKGIIVRSLTRPSIGPDTGRMEYQGCGASADIRFSAPRAVPKGFGSYPDGRGTDVFLLRELRLTESSVA